MNRTLVRTAAVAAIGLVLLLIGEPGVARMYDPKTVETLSGEVLKVETVSGPRGRHHGVHLLVKTEKEEASVHLGPSWYIEKQAVKVAAGDRLTVKGSRVEFKGKPVIIAAEVRKGDAILPLRDEAGTPAWSRGTRGC